MRTIKPRGLVNTPTNPNGQALPSGLPVINPDESRKSIYEPALRKENNDPVRIKGLSEGSSDQNPQDNPNNHMETLVEQQQRGRISIQTVLKDFYKTLEAVSSDPSIQKTVKPYLDVVELQSQTEKPNMALMRENLKIAAKTLDNYITASLGEPSNVVKEWIDALLMQPLDFRQTHLPASNSTGQPKLPKSFSTVLETLDPEAIPRAAVTANSLLGEAKKALQAKDWGEAKAKLTQAQDLTTNETPAAIKAHIFYGLGKLSERDKNTHEALNYYQQAQEALSNTHTNATGMEQKIATALSQISYSHGLEARENKKYQMAFQFFKSALSHAKTSSDTNIQNKVLQQLAALYLDIGKPERAQELLSKLI